MDCRTPVSPTPSVVDRDRRCRVRLLSAHRNPTAAGPFDAAFNSSEVKGREAAVAYLFFRRFVFFAFFAAFALRFFAMLPS